MESDGFLTTEKIRESTIKKRPSYTVSQKYITEDDRGEDLRLAK